MHVAGPRHLHAGFHLSFGLGLIFLLLPVVFLIPWSVQRTGNTCTGMVVHAGINGPGVPGDYAWIDAASPGHRMTIVAEQSPTTALGGGNFFAYLRVAEHREQHSAAEDIAGERR